MPPSPYGYGQRYAARVRRSTFQSRLHCGVFQAIGVLDAEGAATLPVLDTNGSPPAKCRHGMPTGR
ncbi:hypothetical protein I541_5608 [Mycobacteroides abscessus]|nr:hypothetical protein I541_5608 [Mycobacteroides abscessus]